MEEMRISIVLTYL